MQRKRLVIAMAAGAAAALSAVFVRRRTKRAERETPPVGRFLEVQGVRLHYIDRGAGQPVVLLHGNGTMLQDFELSGVTRLAEQKYRVIAFDRPGFGYSTRPSNRVWTPQAQAAVVRAALDALDVHRPIVLGHSWGAFVALAYGLAYPNETAAVVLASGYYFPTFRLDAALLSAPALPVIGTLMRYTLSPLSGRLLWWPILRHLFDPARISDGMRAYPIWMSLRPAQLRAGAAESALMIPSAAALRSRHTELQVPAVVVAGRGDRLIDTAQQSEKVAREFRRGEFRAVEGAGHMVHHTSPEAVMDAIDAAAGMV